MVLVFRVLVLAFRTPQRNVTMTKAQKMAKNEVGTFYIFGGCSCRLGYEGTCCEKGESFLKNLRIQKFAYSGSETMDQGLGVSILKRLVKTIQIHNQRYDNRRNFQTAESC